MVPCTGRAWHESAGPLQHVEGLDLGVFVTGCLVQKLDDGEVVHATGFTPELAHAIVEHLRPLPEAVLALIASATS